MDVRIKAALPWLKAVAFVTVLVGLAVGITSLGLWCGRMHEAGVDWPGALLFAAFFVWYVVVARRLFGGRR